MTNTCMDCGKRISRNAKRCNSCAKKMLWADPKFIAKMSEPKYKKMHAVAIKLAMADPDVRQKISRAAEEQWADPAARDRMSILIKNAHARGDFSSPEYLHKLSAATKKTWTDPEIRQMRSDGLRAAMADPEVKRRMSEASKMAWADPERREKQSGIMSLALADPEVKRRMSEASTEVWANPEMRKMRSRASKLMWADPMYREKRAKTFAKPEVKQKQSDAAKYARARGVYDNDEYREKLSVGVKAAWARGVFDNRAPVGNPSNLELSVLEVLKDYGFKCNSQYSPEECRFYYDILLVKYNTLIEVDGDYWHNEECRPGVAAKDHEKDEWAVNNGFDIIRIPEFFINEEGLGAVVEYVVGILEMC